MTSTSNDIGELIKRIPKYIKMLFFMYKEKDINIKNKGILSIGIAYSASPVDIVPGIIPVVGQLDNLLVMLWCIKKVLKSLPEQKRHLILINCEVTLEQLEADSQLAKDTIKSFTKGTARLASNSGKLLINSSKLTVRRIKKGIFK